jgi:hypothetical protein
MSIDYTYLNIIHTSGPASDYDLIIVSCLPTSLKLQVKTSSAFITNLEGSRYVVNLFECAINEYGDYVY